MKITMAFTEENMLYKGKPMSEMSNEDIIELEERVEKMTRKSNKILEEILHDLQNEPWYDKMRRNINFMAKYRMLINPFRRIL